ALCRAAGPRIARTSPRLNLKRSKRYLRTATSKIVRPSGHPARSFSFSRSRHRALSLQAFDVIHAEPNGVGETAAVAVGRFETAHDRRGPLDRSAVMGWVPVVVAVRVPVGGEYGSRKVRLLQFARSCKIACEEIRTQFQALYG